MIELGLPRAERLRFEDEEWRRTSYHDVLEKSRSKWRWSFGRADWIERLEVKHEYLFEQNVQYRKKKISSEVLGKMLDH
jgi:hypothetical protein